MNKSNTYEIPFKSFFNTELFKTDEFFANMEKIQKSFVENTEMFYKLAEENSLKLKQQFDEQMKLFNNEAFTAQVEKFIKLSEENNKAVQQFLAKHSTFDKNSVMEQLEKLMKIVEENNVKAMKVFQEYLMPKTAEASK